MAYESNKSLFRMWAYNHKFTLGFYQSNNFEFLFGKWQGKATSLPAQYRPDEGVAVVEKVAYRQDSNGVWETMRKFAMKFHLTEPFVNPSATTLKTIKAGAKSNPLQNGWMPNGYTVHFLLLNGASLDEGTEIVTGRKFFAVCDGATQLGKCYWVKKEGVFEITETTVNAVACDAWFTDVLATNSIHHVNVAAGTNEQQWESAKIAAKSKVNSIANTAKITVAPATDAL